MPTQPTGTLAFGDFELDLASGELWRNGVATRLAPQSAAVLALLVSRRGDVVTRGELRAALWPDTTVEFDQGLNFCIRQLRIALSDDAAAPTYIETLPRRGYRFVAPVREVSRAPAPVSAPVRSKRSHARSIVAATVAILVIASLAFVAFRPTRSDARLAVLPFDVAADDTMLVALSAALADALVAATGNDELPVMGPTFTAGFGGTAASPDSIRASLGASHVLSGRIDRDSLGARVFAQLIRTSDRRHVYAARFTLDARASQMSAIADSIARAARTIIAREQL